MSSAGRCIARSTSSGIVVGPGIARNSRPARTVIVVVPLAMLGEGMQGNDGIFKPEHHDNKLKPACGVPFSQGIGDSPPDDADAPHGKAAIAWFRGSPRPRPRRPN